MRDIMEKFVRQEKIDRNEGETGVKNLCRLVKALGYHDSMYFGQFDGASYGDLINFLEDNSGAVEAIKDWIAEQNCDEWKEALQSQLPIRDCYEGGECPDCGEEIPKDAEEGSECVNCGHVFCQERECDEV